MRHLVEQTRSFGFKLVLPDVITQRKSLRDQNKFNCFAFICAILKWFKCGLRLTSRQYPHLRPKRILATWIYMRIVSYRNVNKSFAKVHAESNYETINHLPDDSTRSDNNSNRRQFSNQTISPRQRDSARWTNRICINSSVEFTQKKRGNSRSDALMISRPLGMTS